MAPRCNDIAYLVSRSTSIGMAHEHHCVALDSTSKIFPILIVDVNECASTPCFNSGICTNGRNVYTCTCQPGWRGTNCETSMFEFLFTDLTMFSNIELIYELALP